MPRGSRKLLRSASVNTIDTILSIFFTYVGKRRVELAREIIRKGMICNFTFERGVIKRIRMKPHTSPEHKKLINEFRFFIKSSHEVIRAIADRVGTSTDGTVKIGKMDPDLVEIDDTELQAVFARARAEMRNSSDLRRTRSFYEGRDSSEEEGWEAPPPPRSSTASRRAPARRSSIPPSNTSMVDAWYRSAQSTQNEVARLIGSSNMAIADRLSNVLRLPGAAAELMAAGVASALVQAICPPPASIVINDDE